jgi:hypothetical protein
VKDLGVGIRRVSIGLVVAVVAAIGLVLFAGGRTENPPIVIVTIAGDTAEIARHTTVAMVARRFGLHPRAGDLLDVDGSVLRAGAFRGRLLVDGLPASGRRELRDGDRVAALPGIDRKEGLTRKVVPHPAEFPATPNSLSNVSRACW